MLDHKQCEAFYAVAETGSFELASKQLFITSSAVTLRIQALEKALGQLLLIRGRPCILTKEGQEVLHFLQHTKLLENSLLQSLGRKSSNRFFKISIAANADSLATWLLPALKEALSKEKIALELKFDYQVQTYDLLESGAVNASLSIESVSMKGCHAVYLGSMSYVLVATPSFKKKWFGQTIRRELLCNTPVIVFNDKDHMQSDMLLNLYGLPPNSYPTHFIPSSHDFVQAIELGIGYGYAPLLMVANQLENGSLIELIPDTRKEVALFWHYWEKQSQPMQQITEGILKHARKYLSQINSH
ncbi:LysR family transcriptional regulator (chromosome initiation inhibitor) [Acinetobacter calcoaceticus]|uniref:LysR family transcriptional regulator (Chromosome initiation inhibitor) n=1 Tax=Acinetobacter calcoaceticus TaxID=471 RepID=A0A4R1XZD3_ACICA|nr:LysR family transcriptional regulator (chromosome initiation inhibitor) [Acinetobacter calcoaceticus]